MQRLFVTHSRSLKKLGQLLVVILTVGIVTSLIYVKSSWAGNAPTAPQLRKTVAVLPGPLPFLTLPDNPPQRTQVFCCTAGDCTPVDSLTACGPDAITLVCDTTNNQSICVPLGQINTKPFLKNR